MLRIFIDVVSEETANAKLARKAKDWVALSYSLHRMKSNMRMLGLGSLVELVDRIETAALIGEGMEDLEQDMTQAFQRLDRVLLDVNEDVTCPLK